MNIYISGYVTLFGRYLPTLHEMSGQIRPTIKFLKKHRIISFGIQIMNSEPWGKYLKVKVGDNHLVSIWNTLKGVLCTYCSRMLIKKIPAKKLMSFDSYHVNLYIILQTSNWYFIGTSFFSHKHPYKIPLRTKIRKREKNIWMSD